MRPSAETIRATAAAGCGFADHGCGCAICVAERAMSGGDIEDFLDWLYEFGPALDEVPREHVLTAYRAWRERAG